MRKKTLALLLSILIILMPFLGFPSTVKTVFYVVVGILLVLLIELMTVQYHYIKHDEVDINLGIIENEDNIQEDQEKKPDEIFEQHLHRDDFSDLTNTEEEVKDHTTIQKHEIHATQQKNKFKKK